MIFIVEVTDGSEIVGLPRKTEHKRQLSGWSVKVDCVDGHCVAYFLENPFAALRFFASVRELEVIK